MTFPAAAALLATFLGATPLIANEAHGTLEQARQNARTADFRASGHLVKVDPSGTRVRYPITVKGHWFPGVLRVMVELSPASSAGQAEHLLPLHVLLEMHPGGPASIRTAHPGDAAPAVIPEDRWTDGLAGTGFSYEDFLESHLFWAGQAVSEHVKYGARDCDLIKSTPGAADKTHYSAASTWLDRGIAFPVYEEKTVKGGNSVREFTYFGLRHTGGTWSASQIEEKNHGQPGSTLLIIDRGSAKANLTAADFSPERLVHF
jgi:hypothetical protein